MDIATLRSTLQWFDLNKPIVEIQTKLGNMHITQFKRLRYLIGLMKDAGMSSQSLNEAYNYLLSFPETDEYVTSETLVAQFESALEVVYQGAMALNSFLQTNYPDDADNILRIKLPPANSFGELENIMSDLKKAFDIPLRHPEIDGEIEILRGESGSVLLVLAIAGAGLAVGRKAYKLFAEIAWSAAVIRKKNLECDLFAEQVRNLKLQNDQKEVYLDAQREYISTLVENEATGIAERMEIKAQPEFIEQLKVSIKSLDELFRKGFELLPSATAPESIDNLFPDMKKVISIQSKQPQISQRASDNSSE